MKTINSRKKGIETTVIVLVTGLLLTACGRHNNNDQGKVQAVAQLLSRKTQGISPHKRGVLFAFLAPRVGTIRSGLDACKKDYFTNKKAVIEMAEPELQDSDLTGGRKVRLSIDQLIAQKGEVISFFTNNPEKLSESCKTLLQTVAQIRSYIQAKR